jgi:hypothetical protein
MKLFNNSTTNLIIFIFSIASIVLAYQGKMDVKDFVMMCMMVLGYKFTKNTKENLATPTV